VQGRPLGPDCEGEIVIRGGSVISCYVEPHRDRRKEKVVKIAKPTLDTIEGTPDLEQFVW
jgi:hypothetical protein